MQDENVEALAETFRLLGDPNRLRIVLCCLDKPASVGAIVEAVGLSPARLPHALPYRQASRNGWSNPYCLALSSV